MRCPECGEKMSCIDSRDVSSETFGYLRRRRYDCKRHGRFTGVETIIPPNMKCEKALRSVVDTDFKESVRSIANKLSYMAGGR